MHEPPVHQLSNQDEEPDVWNVNPGAAANEELSGEKCEAASRHVALEPEQDISNTFTFLVSFFNVGIEENVSPRIQTTHDRKTIKTIMPMARRPMVVRELIK